MNELIQLPKCEFSLTGAKFDRGLDFDEWAAVGKKVLSLMSAMPWIVGDWINFGADRYHRKRYDIALQVFGNRFQKHTLQNISSVCSAFESSRRREHLSFTHHAEVAAFASLTQKEQDKYLKFAEEHDLSVIDLRELIRTDLAEVDDSEGPKPMPSPNAWTNRLALWVTQQEPETWPKRRRDMVKEELRPIVEFWEKL